MWTRPASAARAAATRLGSTLVELLITTLILLGVFGAIGLAVSSGSSAYEQGVAAADVEAQARRMVERIARELMDADRSSLILTPPTPWGAQRVDFQRGEGYAAGALVLGPRRSIRLVYDPGEVDDGLDNNGNGLVDECRVELVPDVLGAPAEAIGWGGFVREYLEGELPNAADDNGNGIDDERGLCMTFDANTNTLTVRLTIERPGPRGSTITRTVETAVLVRND